MYDSKIIEFKGMPLFQKAQFKPPYLMQGEIKDFACFFYMTKGTLTSYDTRGIHTISAREAILKNCGNYVQTYHGEAATDECEAVAVYLYPELLKTIYKNEVPSFLTENHSIPVPKKLVGNQLIEQYMNNLAIYFESPESFDEELGILKLKELMLILLKSENHESIRKLLSEIFAQVNVKFKQTIENNIFNPLGMDQLAFICNMSLSTFKREFKKTFGETPAKYIKNRRLNHAASLLSCSDDSITTIAYDSGFQDITTFSANFQEKFQVAPSKYRLTQNRN
ncbi:MAG: hypothetical protein Crog4KO_17510 [Crocinitomicaceae bacterium]